MGSMLITNAHCVLVDVASHLDICYGRFSVGYGTSMIDFNIPPYAYVEWIL